MKLLPLATAGSILAGVAYFATSPPKPDIATDPTKPKFIDVPFVVVSKVRVIWEQHLKLSAANSRGDVQPAQTRIRLAVEDIKERLLADGIHEEAEIIEVVEAAALQAGLHERQSASVVAAFREGGKQHQGGDVGFIGALRESLAGTEGLPPGVIPKE